MKINKVQTFNNSNTTFNGAGYYTSLKIKGITDAFREAAKSTHSHLQPIEAIRINESMRSFNAFYKALDKLSVRNIENEMYHKFGIRSDFKGDKIMAGCSAFTANIFHKLGLPQPKSVVSARLQDHVLGSCYPVTRDVSFNNEFEWKTVQDEAITARMHNHKSCVHFLHTFIHEFMHSYHAKKLNEISQHKYVNPLFDQIKNSKLYEAIRQMPVFETRLLNEGGANITNRSAKDYIAKKVSLYGSTLPVEMFAEIGAKMVANELDMRTLLPRKNPFIFKDFTEDKYLMKMMNDFYNGKFDGYIN